MNCKCTENESPPLPPAKLLATVGHSVSRDGCGRSQSGGLGGGRGVVEVVAFGCCCFHIQAKPSKLDKTE